MQTLDLAVICSAMPGFIRSIGSSLAGQFRQLECYSVPEARQIVQLHDPEFVVVDLRKAEKIQCDRIWALLQNTADCQCLAVVDSGELKCSSIPIELTTRIRVIEQATTDTDLQQVASDVAQAMLDPTTQPANTDRLIADQYQTKTPELRFMLDRLQIAAQHDVTILLIGETGSGKTHLARLIHEASARQAEPFVTVSCGALPGELIESELFGHTKGSFTSAHADKQGKFLSAGQGTILLDEIDVLTPEQQVKLLRVIETGQYEAVGSNKTQHVAARIIAASNLELQSLVEQGRFRPDLYYRLNTLTFRLLPLRKRLPDIELLAAYFVRLYANRHGIESLSISQQFLDALLRYPWPGNVREMENAIRSAVIYSKNGLLEAETLPPHILAGTAGPANDPSVANSFSNQLEVNLENQIKLTEKDIIEQALLENSFSRTRTAKRLGISRVTLYNKMKKYGMMPKNRS